jgi:hypothetical protein
MVTKPIDDKPASQANCGAIGFVIRRMTRSGRNAE